MNWILTVSASCIVVATVVSVAPAQQAEFNYDESKVGEYTLPDPLVFADGERVADAETWRQRRRPEIFKLFETHVYGRVPGRPDSISFDDVQVDRKALDGRATRKQVTIHFRRKQRTARIDLLIYLPNGAKRPAPTFLGLNFSGNHTIHADPGIKLSTAWMRSDKDKGVVDNLATESSRGTSAGQWQVEKVLERGYAVATVYYGDIDPDFDDGFQNGVHPLLFEAEQPKPDECGSIGAWAWGLSRVMDYFETDSDVDQRRVIVLGHSRLGKTSLWAGAQDERFAIVISNNSGCGGAALNRRWFGETVKRINTAFPHWFCDNFNGFNDNEAALPVDQHLLIALIAPRPVYVASAQEDLWADPRGEFLSAKLAEPVFQLLGKTGLTADEMPDVNQPVMGTIGYHIRTGKHDVTDYDWQRFMDFADRNLPQR